MKNKKVDELANEGFRNTNVLIDTIKLNAWKNDRIIYITEEITGDTELIINHMLESIWDMDDAEKVPVEKLKPIIIKISSPGGSVYPALSIISTIERMKRYGYRIYTVAYGLCASAALQIYTVGTYRYAQQHTRFMVHQIGAYEFGATNLKSSRELTKDLDDLWDRLRGIIKTNTKMTDEFLDKITQSSIDHYFWPDEAMTLGVVDEIL